MKILVLSDIHYPFTDEKALVDIIREEKAERLIFLGDTLQDSRYFKEFLELVRTAGGTNLAFIQGDEDPLELGKRAIEIVLQGKKVMLTHGHQFNISSDNTTGGIAEALKRIHPIIPVLAYAVLAKFRTRRRDACLILGHAHAMAYFPQLKVACAGSLTTLKNIYNDRGYIVLEAGPDGTTTLTLRLLGASDRVFAI